VDRRRGGEVPAAHHARDFLVAVVDNRSEVIGDQSGPAEEHGIPHLDCRILREIETAFLCGIDALRSQTQTQGLPNGAPTALWE
jgi:hypothetical protein